MLVALRSFEEEGDAGATPLNPDGSKACRRWNEPPRPETAHPFQSDARARESGLRGRGRCICERRHARRGGFQVPEAHDLSPQSQDRCGHFLQPHDDAEFFLDGEAGKFLAAALLGG